MERRPEFQKKAYELLQEQLKQIINLLPDFDKEVISMRFGLEDDYSHTLEEVCSYFNIKRDTIRLIESNVLKLIKERTENLSKNTKLSSFQENILSIINSLPSNERLIVKTKYNLENGLSLSDDEILKIIGATSNYILSQSRTTEKNLQIFINNTPDFFDIRKKKSSFHVKIQRQGTTLGVNAS